MPSYSFRCAQDGVFDASFSMADAPAGLACPACGVGARRVITAPHLSVAGSSGFKLIDDAARSAHEPAVVSSLPASGRQRATPVTRNPLHAKLPRQ